MYYKEIADYNEILQRIEENDANYRENPKWQYYRKQQDLMYLARAKQELIELKQKVEIHNKRIKYLEEYIEKYRYLINEVRNDSENKSHS